MDETEHQNNGVVVQSSLRKFGTGNGKQVENPLPEPVEAAEVEASMANFAAEISTYIEKCGALSVREAEANLQNAKEFEKKCKKLALELRKAIMAEADRAINFMKSLDEQAGMLEAMRRAIDVQD